MNGDYGSVGIGDWDAEDIKKVKYILKRNKEDCFISSLFFMKGGNLWESLF